MILSQLTCKVHLSFLCSAMSFISMSVLPSHLKEWHLALVNDQLHQGLQRDCPQTEGKSIQALTIYSSARLKELVWKFGLPGMFQGLGVEVAAEAL